MSSKQDQLKGAHGQIVGFNAQGTPQAQETGQPNGIATLDQSGVLAESQRPTLAQIGGTNPNLLINSDFRNPVNQKGQMEYTGAGYTIDMWTGLNGSIITIVPDGVKINGNLYQYIDKFQWLSNKTVTFSLLVHSVVGWVRVHVAYRNSSGVYQTVAYTDIQSDGLITATATFPDLTDAQQCFIRIFSYTADSTCIAQAAKLELGDHQTLVRQNESGEWEIIDPPSNPALELAKCQRYYWNSRGPQNYTFISSSMIGRTTSMIEGAIYLPVSLRTTPTARIVNDMAVRKSTAATIKVLNSENCKIECYSSASNIVGLSITLTDGTTPFTVGETYNLLCNNKLSTDTLLRANGMLEIDCNL